MPFCISTSRREKLSEIEATRADLKAALAGCNDTVLHLPGVYVYVSILTSLFSLFLSLSLSSYLQLFIKKHTLSKRKDVEKRTNKTFSLSLPSSTTPFQIEKATKENPVDIS